MQSHIETSNYHHLVVYMVSDSCWAWLYLPQKCEISRGAPEAPCGALGCLGTQFENHRVSLVWEDTMQNWDSLGTTGWLPGSKQL